MPSTALRVDQVDWQAVHADLLDGGIARIPRLLDAEQCRSLASLYERDDAFRSRVIMQRHGYGSGEYRYFTYPLPQLITELRESAYSRLVGIANDWNAALRIDARYPERLEDYLASCHAAGQTRPTPLLLRYGRGDYNCLHQDLYGAHRFPLQLAILLSRPGEDFSGGELVVTEQRPRMQSRVEVVPLQQGDAVVFAVNERPRQGTRGVHRVKMRHGVSRIRDGQRFAAGIIFHDAA